MAGVAGHQLQPLLRVAQLQLEFIRLLLALHQRALHLPLLRLRRAGKHA